eukprot:5098752-Pyramimonas_sp.AAC.1
MALAIAIKVPSSFTPVDHLRASRSMGLAAGDYFAGSGAEPWTTLSSSKEICKDGSSWPQLRYARSSSISNSCVIWNMSSNRVSFQRAIPKS